MSVAKTETGFLPSSFAKFFEKWLTINKSY